MLKRMLAMACAAALACACGDDADPNPNPPRQQTQASGLSEAFETTCAVCHGPEGKGQKEYPAIPGSKDDSAYIAIVRSGRGDMPASDASRISDAELKADYAWLTTQRQ